MKNLKTTILFSLLAFLCGCQQLEIIDSAESLPPKMKTVKLSAEINTSETRASLDSETGAFSWQSGDLISVLATDGKFYDFILESGASEKNAEFVGEIPEETEVTTVATYPRIVVEGTSSTGILNGNTLGYVLPSEWNYAKDVSNVPMVASFETGADHMSFKQVGGVMRFPVKNLPMNASFVVTMKDKTITGSFPVELDKLGTTAMVAGAEESVLTINYSSELDGVSADFNVPVPIGIYKNFKVEIKDANSAVLFEKEYVQDKTVNRATLLSMKELVLPERPMVVSEVWPFFVDARVVFTKREGVSKYAAYVDGAEEPVILDAEDWGNNSAVLIGGTFSHNTKHTVAVAKVVDGNIVADSKSEAVEFTTAGMRQLTNNTGTRFVAVGWDDVTITNAPVWDPAKKRYSLVPFEGNQDKRGYQVQLYAADKTTVLYDLYPFDGHNWFEGAFCGEVNFGKVGGVNAASPTALTFCWLEPGKDYYFRVKALDEPVYLDNTNGNYNPDGTTDPTKPVPYPFYSERGGCAWSEFVKLSTDPAHVPSANEILYEGFDDLLVHMDLANWSHVVVPDFTPEYGSMSKDDYNATLAEGYKAFFKNPDITNTRFFVQQYGSEFTAEKYGMFTEGYVSGQPRHFNEYAGGLEGWSHGSSRNKSADQLRPAVGIAQMGRGATYKDSAPLYTPAFNSNKLEYDIATKCIVTVNVTPWLGSSVDNNAALKSIKVSVVRDGQFVETKTVSMYESDSEKWNDAIQYSSASDFVRYFPFFELQFEVYLKNGDQLCFDRAVAGEKGSIGFDDIKVEVVPGVYEGDEVDPNDTGIGTAPNDNINYDVFGLGEFPITYYYGPPTSSYQKTDASGNPYYDHNLTVQVYQDVKAAGFNIATYVGEVDRSIDENARILGICNDLGLKFISWVGENVSDIPAMKEKFYSSPAYLGTFLRDEPNASEFNVMGNYVTEFNRAMPDKEVYNNLFPMYASMKQLGTSTYEEHVDQYLAKVPTKSVSVDHYCLLSETVIRKNYYPNLDIVRKKTLDAQIPYWAITQAGSIGNSTIDPNEHQQRWSVWSNIAMGSKGISYFTYWTPSVGDIFDSGYMINRDGSKRDIYHWIKKINTDINTIGKKLLPCHADGAILSAYYYPMWDKNNSGKGRTKYGPIKAVKSAVDLDPVLCGCFRDARSSENGANYKGYKALVMSQLPTRGTNGVTGTLTLDPAITKVTITVNNTSQVIELSNNLVGVSIEKVKVSYANRDLQLVIPDGEAALIEF